MTVIDLGQTYRYRYTSVDENGDPADAGSVTYVITRPDGTSTSPAAATDVGVGLYDIAHLTAQDGRHVLSGMATGGVLGSNVDIFTDVFEVTSVAGIVSVDEAFTHLRLVDGEDDADLVRAFILTSSECCEAYTGRVWRRRVVTGEVHDGGRPVIRLRHSPVASITSVTESGTAVPASGYVLDGRRGRLYRGTATASSLWLDGRVIVSVSYVAEPDDGVVPAPIRHGVLEHVRHLWESRRGGSGLPRQGAGDEWVPILGYSIPRRVAELWDLAPRRPRVA